MFGILSDQMNNSLFFFYPKTGYMQFLMPDSLIKQEPVSPHRFTPSPNPMLPTSVLPNMQTMMYNVPSVSPLQNPNILNQQCQPQASTAQFTMTNNPMDDFLISTGNKNIQMDQTMLSNNNLNNLNQLDQTTTAQGNDLDSYGNVNLSSLLDLDSQQQISTNDTNGFSGLLQYINNLENAENNAQQVIPIQVQTIQPDTFNMEEENMTDSFKQFSIE